jgi:hypothetical protein
MMSQELINGVWVETDLFGKPIHPIVNSPAAVADPAVAATSPAAGDLPVAVPPVAASGIRKLYEQSVFNAWSAYDAEVRQIYASYTDAFELGKVQKNDATFNWKNTSLVKAWEKRDAILRDLWSKYQATGDPGLELKAVIIRAIHFQPVQYTPQADNGSYLVKKIVTRNAHDCYLEIEAFIKTSGLYCLKIHDGFLVLISDNDPGYRQLFTVSPLDAVRS